MKAKVITQPSNEWVTLNEALKTPGLYALKSIHGTEVNHAIVTKDSATFQTHLIIIFDTPTCGTPIKIMQKDFFSWGEWSYRKISGKIELTFN